MAAVDFASFYGEFLRQFLQRTVAVVDSQHVTQLLAMFNAEQASLLLLKLCLKVKGCVYSHSPPFGKSCIDPYVEVQQWEMGDWENSPPPFPAELKPFY